MLEAVKTIIQLPGIRLPSMIRLNCRAETPGRFGMPVTSGGLELSLQSEF